MNIERCFLCGLYFVATVHDYLDHSNGTCSPVHQECLEQDIETPLPIEQFESLFLEPVNDVQKPHDWPVVMEDCYPWPPANDVLPWAN